MAQNPKNPTKIPLSQPPQSAKEPPEPIADRDLLARKEPPSEVLVREIIARPYRHPVLHWIAFVLALAAVALSIFWVLNSRQAVSLLWMWLDVGISLFFLAEFFTRSGFRWNPLSYSFSRFYDFVSMVPIGVLVYNAVPFLGVWQWIILVARTIRAIDRLLGDGFVKRNFLALTSALEEEITDRLMVRILNRIHDDLVRGRFASVVGEALLQNKQSVLKRIKSEHPSQGIGAGLMHITGLEQVLEKVEEKTYDSIVEILMSPEVEKAVHDALDSSFSVLRAEVEKKSWRENLGFQKRRMQVNEKRIA